VRPTPSERKQVYGDFAQRDACAEAEAFFEKSAQHRASLFHRYVCGRAASFLIRRLHGLGLPAGIKASGRSAYALRATADSLREIQSGGPAQPKLGGSSRQLGTPPSHRIMSEGWCAQHDSNVRPPGS
jgi:hypothetical protein